MLIQDIKDLTIKVNLNGEFELFYIQIPLPILLSYSFPYSLSILFVPSPITCYFALVLRDAWRFLYIFSRVLCPGYLLQETKYRVQVLYTLSHSPCFMSKLLSIILCTISFSCPLSSLILYSLTLRICVLYLVAVTHLPFRMLCTVAGAAGGESGVFTFLTPGPSHPRKDTTRMSSHLLVL